jgi:hypothetical protein
MILWYTNPLLSVQALLYAHLLATLRLYAYSQYKQWCPIASIYYE